ncbi:tRNA lysidine(34) synthetase TilS [Candidatus Liberibacter asiaticus]|uniref:tRNA lysidine(34) synthetase TilS n=1 Tax=Liberibacter asiaticus TaxID=34021 RepID=UPI001FCE6BE0|nr:tRNA lysidine(34) synthetase TilS [Candidatus Liberibacter asiaticus]MCU7489771.1 tRNA lysidine(34) synthetase TilS [Candidatus Liberibacter asiaticus]WCM57030.1 tRNA lysidine(34) synthetase TilS [Candidatus Liberibacter asiaticus]
MYPAHILVAVSGGSDSMGLLIALHSVLSDRSFGKIKFSAISVDHCLRETAKDEVRYVSDVCSRLRIAHSVVSWKNSKPQTGLMAAAREARYALISEHAKTINATLIMTAHTFDDQLETVYMRSQRDYAEKGMGLSGMCDTILYDLNLWISRPFLRCRREDIRSFLLQRNISWCEDPSNTDDRFERVRVRRFVRDIDLHALYLKMKKFQDLRVKVNNAVAMLIPKYLTVHMRSIIAISQDILNIDSTLLFYLLRVSAAICGGQISLPGYRSMERVMLFLKSGKRGCVSIGRVVIDRRANFLWITRAVRNLPTLILYPEETTVWDGRYQFQNLSDSLIQIGPQSYRKADVPSGIPPIIAQRALSSMPSKEGGKPLLAPFSRFMTKFDLPVAYAFSISFGKVFIPRLPFF